MLSRKRVEMFARVAEWERSSMSIVAFSKTCGITERQLYYWAQKVRESASSADDNPEFIEIGQLVKAGQLAKTAPLREVEIQSVKLPNPQIELIFPSGLCVKIYG
jgi:transposase-like protein